MQNNFRMPLEELCARVMGMARDYVRHFPASDVATDVLERNSLRRTLDAFAQDGGLSYRDDRDLEIIEAVLNREIERETLGWISSFEGVVDAEHGAVGRDVEIRDLTERGKRIDTWLKQLRAFARQRASCRTRLDAVKLIMGR